MFFPPRRAPKTVKEKSQGVPIVSGLPGIQLRLDVDHMQLLGTLAMFGLSQNPGLKGMMQEFTGFVQQAQATADTLTVQMENMQKEFQKVQTKMMEMNSFQEPVQESRRAGYPPPDPLMLFQQLFRLMSMNR